MSLFPWRKKATVSAISPADDDAPRPASLLSYQVSGFQGIGKREEQQDAYRIVNGSDVIRLKNNGLLLVVADGIGGMRGGKEAGVLAVDSLEASFELMDRAGDISRQLCESVLTASERVLGAIGGGGGCTVVACIIYQEMLYFASVGDSALYLLRNGDLCRLNREQNCLQTEYLCIIRSGRADPSLADDCKDKTALTQFVGMDGLSELDHLIKPLPLRTGDILLVCSDGVDGSISNEVLRDCMSVGTARDICSRIEEDIFNSNRRYQDNYTAVTVKCT